LNDRIPAALIVPTPGGDPAATLSALTRQTVPPSSLVHLTGKPATDRSASPQISATFADALGRAMDFAPWVWLVDAGVEPAPSALEALLGTLSGMPSDPPPGLLCSQVVTADGRPDRASIPVLDADARRARRVVSALEQRAVALRAARYGSLLVDGHAALGAGAGTRSGAAAYDLAWTARLLARRAGVLVPHSTAIRRSGRRSGRALSRPTDLLGAARLLASVPSDDRLWFLVWLVSGPPAG
jgi:hypothetical protein